LIRCRLAGPPAGSGVVFGALSAACADEVSAATALCFFMNSQAKPTPAATRSTMPTAVRDADLIAASLIARRIASSEESARVDGILMSRPASLLIS
jgi:hypothetical protein